MKLSGGDNANIRIRLIRIPVINIQPVRIEITNIDEVAVGSAPLCSFHSYFGENLPKGIFSLFFVSSF